MATRDTLIFVDEMPCSDEALVRASNVVACLGGKGVIPALTLKRLGIATGLLCLTSVADRDRSWNNLLSQTLGRQYLIPALEEANTAWIMVGVDGHTYTAVQERSCHPSWTAQLATMARRFLDDFSAVYIAAEDPDLLAAVHVECVQRPTKIVVNPSNALLGRLAETPQTFEKLLARASCLIMNEAESAAALKQLGISDWSYFESYWLRCIVVTAGSKGGKYSEAPFSEWTEFEPVRSTLDVICPVGAGDVFTGAFLRYWLVESDPAGIACQKAAALASEKIGQQLTGIALDD
jgi:sugar/nucleoside kinase (ribokinase family)